MRPACVKQREFPHKAVSGDLVGPGSEYFETTSTSTPLDVTMLSLPADGAEPRPLAELLGPAGADKSVLPTEVRGERLAAADALTAFMDPRMRKSHKAYTRLIQRLVRCGVLCYGTKFLCDVGLFEVAKKSGKQRLVVDARRANLCFDDPTGVSLPTSASFGRLEAAPGQILHCM